MHSFIEQTRRREDLVGYNKGEMRIFKVSVSNNYYIIRTTAEKTYFYENSIHGIYEVLLGRREEENTEWISWITWFKTLSWCILWSLLAKSLVESFALDGGCWWKADGGSSWLGSGVEEFWGYLKGDESFRKGELGWDWTSERVSPPEDRNTGWRKSYNKKAKGKGLDGKPPYNTD